MAIGEFLRSVPLFADLSDSDLANLCDLVESVRVPAGAWVFAEGAPGDRAYVIRDGQIEIVKNSAGRELSLAVRGAGEIFGEVALLEDTPRMAGARARTDATLVAVRKETIDELVKTSPSAARAMFHTVLARWRATDSMLRQSEKMAQLGTLTAGVAHELNNPAAAVKRGADQLREALGALSRADVALATLELGGEQQRAMRAAIERSSERAGRPSPLSTLERADRTSAIEELLEQLGVADGWEHAATLADLDYNPDALRALAASVGSARLGVAVACVATTYSVQTLLAEISHGATRISEIIKSLKSYSYLDRAPVQSVDVHQGLDDTLMLLRHKFKAGIEVRRDYATDLPKIEAYGSELNQVWTNLLDNAADALDGNGHVAIRTRRDGDFVVVEITDDGPGIPAHVLPRIFEAFFTTKPPGKGTGLGLDISWRIVVHRHRGDLKVLSEPGKTTFITRLPVVLDAPAEQRAVATASTRASDEEMRQILLSAKTIAVVGISSQAGRPAHDVPAYLQNAGYTLVPVNPNATEVLGVATVPNLRSLSTAPDVVLLFRPTDEVPMLVDDAIAIGARTVWMQEGILHEAAAAKARTAGLGVVMDACMRSAHRRLITAARPPATR